MFKRYASRFEMNSISPNSVKQDQNEEYPQEKAICIKSILKIHVKDKHLSNISLIGKFSFQRLPK